MEEKVDFYMENGYCVFTEQYHLKRGYCCKSGCRHCPWKYKKDLQTPMSSSNSEKEPLE
jgi:hypothetical protein